MSTEPVVAKPSPAEAPLKATRPHPLDQLTSRETSIARDAVLGALGRNAVVEFRAISLEEPRKAELLAYLELEHSGRLSSQTQTPARVARLQYDIVHPDKSHEYVESLVDIEARRETMHRVVDKKHQPSLTMSVSS